MAENGSQFGAEQADARLDIAAEWHVRLMDDRRRTTIDMFEQWRAADPLNAIAYAEVVAAVNWVDNIGEAPELHALRREASDRQARPIALPTRWWPRAFRPVLAACAAAAVFAFAGVNWWASGDSVPTGETYATRVGERADLTLADGSTVRLNSRSAIKVSYTDGERRMALLRGQALFKVAKDADRPFIVVAGDERITALGTEFDVSISERQELRVALIEGRVAVRGKAQAPTFLKPNDVLRSASGRTMVLHGTDVRRLTNWTQGIVSFENTPLSEAAEELNRYSNHPIILNDRDLGTIRVSGTFRAGQSRAFVDVLEIGFPVTVSREAGSFVIHAKSP